MPGWRPLYWNSKMLSQRNIAHPRTTPRAVPETKINAPSMSNSARNRIMGLPTDCTNDTLLPGRRPPLRRKSFRTAISPYRQTVLVNTINRDDH